MKQALGLKTKASTAQSSAPTVGRLGQLILAGYGDLA
jgi:hypothetical protein